MNDITVNIQLPPDLTHQVVRQWLEAAKSYEVDCAEAYEAAAVDLKNIKQRLHELEEERKNLTRPLDQAKRRIMDFFRPPMDMLASGEQALKGAMLDYRLSEERKRRAHEAHLREQARMKRERLEAEAQAAAEKGAEDEAQAKREEAEDISMPILAPTTPKPQGISISEIWRAHLVDKLALVRAVAEGQAPAELVEVNMQVANRLALSLKQAFAYPGLKAEKVQTVAARRS